MCSRAVLPAPLTTIEQRFLRGPSLWSGKSCLVTVLDMGPLARALSSDFPGLGERVLSLFPGMHDYAEALRRGSFIAEVLGRIALELQRMRGAQVQSRNALTVHGKRNQVKIIIAGQTEQMAAQALAQAMAILAGLCAGVRAIIPGLSFKKPARQANSALSLPFMHAGAIEHAQHEPPGQLAAPC